MIGPAWTGRGRPATGYFTKRTAEAWLTHVLQEARRGTLPGAVRTGANFRRRRRGVPALHQRRPWPQGHDGPGLPLSDRDPPTPGVRRHACRGHHRADDRAVDRRAPEPAQRQVAALQPQPKQDPRRFTVSSSGRAESGDCPLVRRRRLSATPSLRVATSTSLRPRRSMPSPTRPSTSKTARPASHP